MQIIREILISNRNIQISLRVFLRLTQLWLSRTANTKSVSTEAEQDQSQALAGGHADSRSQFGVICSRIPS